MAYSINGSWYFYKTNTFSLFDEESTVSIQFNGVTINMMLPTKFVWILIPRYLTFICSTHLKTGSHFCHFCGNETLWNEKSFFKKNNITFHLLWVFPIIKILNAVDLRISALVETTSFAVLLWHYYYDIMNYYDSYLKSVKKKNEAWWK